MSRDSLVKVPYFNIVDCHRMLSAGHSRKPMLLPIAVDEDFRGAQHSRVDLHRGHIAFEELFHSGQLAATDPKFIQVQMVIPERPASVRGVDLPTVVEYEEIVSRAVRIVGKDDLVPFIHFDHGLGVDQAPARALVGERYPDRSGGVPSRGHTQFVLALAIHENAGRRRSTRGDRPEPGFDGESRCHLRDGAVSKIHILIDAIERQAIRIMSPSLLPKRPLAGQEAPLE